MKQKIKNCAKQLKKLGYDSLLITNPANITYLSGFRQGEGYLLITTEEELIYFTNFLYMQTAKKIKHWKVITSSSNSNIFSLIAEKIKRIKHKRVGFEAKTLPFLEYKTLFELLLKEKIEFSGTSDFVEKIGMIKNQKEISLIKKSVQISKEAFEFVKEIFDEEMSEKDLSIEVEKFLRLKGDNEIAFDTIVASGKNTVFPHYSPKYSRIGKKFFLIDLGSKYYGYCADLTRIFFWSKMPLLFTRIYDTIRKAQDIGIKKVKEGVTAAEVDKAARDFIDKQGWGKYFGHGLGHGIGLSVHEPPFIQPNSEEILKEGMVITIEPAVYFKDKFGIRIEDMVLVKQKKGEVLSGDIYR